MYNNGDNVNETQWCLFHRGTSVRQAKTFVSEQDSLSGIILLASVYVTRHTYQVIYKMINIGTRVCSFHRIVAPAQLI